MQSPFNNGGGAPSFAPEAAAWGGAANIRNSASQNLATIANWASSHIDAIKKENDQGKAALAAAKASPELLAKTGYTLEALAGMSARAQAAAINGAFEAQGYQRAQTEIAQQVQNTASLMQQMAQSANSAPINNALTVANTAAVTQQTATATQKLAADKAFGNDINRVYENRWQAANATMRAGGGINNPPPVTPDQIISGMSPQALQDPENAKLLLNYHMLASQSGDPAHLINAQAAMTNAIAAKTNADTNAAKSAKLADQTAASFPQLRGYAVVPNGKGSFEYKPVKPSAQEQIEINKLGDSLASSDRALAAYDAKIASAWGFQKAGLQAKKDAELKARAEMQARLEDLKSGQGLTPGAAAGATPGAASSLWEDFNKTVK